MASGSDVSRSANSEGVPEVDWNFWPIEFLPHQVEAIEFALAMPADGKTPVRILLNHGTGTGKTLTAITLAFLASQACRGSIAWRDERLKKWTKQLSDAGHAKEEFQNVAVVLKKTGGMQQYQRDLTTLAESSGNQFYDFVTLKTARDVQNYSRSDVEKKPFVLISSGLSLLTQSTNKDDPQYDQFASFLESVGVGILIVDDAHMATKTSKTLPSLIEASKRAACCIATSAVPISRLPSSWPNMISLLTGEKSTKAVPPSEIRRLAHGAAIRFQDRKHEINVIVKTVSRMDFPSYKSAVEYSKLVSELGKQASQFGQVEDVAARAFVDEIVEYDGDADTEESLFRPKEYPANFHYYLQEAAALASFAAHDLGLYMELRSKTPTERTRMEEETLESATSRIEKFMFEPLFRSFNDGSPKADIEGELARDMHQRAQNIIFSYRNVFEEPKDETDRVRKFIESVRTKEGGGGSVEELLKNGGKVLLYDPDRFEKTIEYLMEESPGIYITQLAFSWLFDETAPVITSKEGAANYITELQKRYSTLLEKYKDDKPNVYNMLVAHLRQLLTRSAKLKEASDAVNALLTECAVPTPYSTTVKDMLQQSETPGKKAIAVNTLRKLLRFTCDPYAFPTQDDTVESFDSLHKSSQKTRAVVQIIRDAHSLPDSLWKFVVTALDTLYMAVLQQQLPLAGVEGKQIIVHTTSTSFLQASDKGKIHVYVAPFFQTSSGGQLVNTEDSALSPRCLIMTNLWWNHSRLHQLVGRMYTISQTHSLKIFVPIIRGSIDSSMLSYMTVTSQMVRDQQLNLRKKIQVETEQRKNALESIGTIRYAEKATIASAPSKYAIEFEEDDADLNRVLQEAILDGSSQYDEVGALGQLDGDELFAGATVSP